MTRTNGSCRDSVVWRLRPTLCRSKWRKSERRPVRGLSRFATEPGPSVGLYDRKILNHAPAARGGVTRAWRKKPAPERALEPMFAPESVGTAARHRPTKAVGECAGGCIGSAVRKDHDLLKVKNQWHLGVSAARRDRPTTPRESGKFAGLSRTCRFVARTNELFQKGEAPRTTDVDSLSRPQKREQATKSRTTKSRPPNPAPRSSWTAASLDVI